MFVRLRGRFRLDLAARKRWVRRALGSFAPPNRYRSPGFVWIPDFLPASAFRYTWVRSVAALPCQTRGPRRRVRSDLFSGRLEPANELSWRGDAAPGPPRSIDPVPAEGTAYAGAGHRIQAVYPIMGKNSRAGSALFRMPQAGSGPTKGSDAARGHKPEDARGMSRAGRPGRGLGRLFSHCAGRQLNARRRVQLEDRCRRGSQRFTS